MERLGGGRGFAMVSNVAKLESSLFRCSAPSGNRAQLSWVNEFALFSTFSGNPPVEDSGKEFVFEMICGNFS